MKALAALSILAMATALPATAASDAAPASGKPGRSCFWTRDLEGHSFGGPSTIYMRVRTKDIYQVETTGNCTTAHMRSDPLILNPAPMNGLICGPLDLDLKIGHAGGVSPATPCIVQSIRKLTPAEADAIPKKLRP